MTTSTKPLLVKCPTCQKPVAWLPEQRFKPFCCERCRLIDLGEWAMETKRIPGESVLLDGDPDEDVFFH
jgi:endogenous inhibitor of DNA gyrase (YacG/DUF329 family)